MSQNANHSGEAPTYELIFHLLRLNRRSGHALEVIRVAKRRQRPKRRGTGSRGPRIHNPSRYNLDCSGMVHPLGTKVTPQFNICLSSLRNLERRLFA